MEKSYKKVNQELVDVYKDTLLLSTQFPHGGTTKFEFDDYSILNVKNYIHKKKGNLDVLNLDTVSALQRHTNESNCILNMASAKRPGGGVSWGAKAQEEALFRCSNLSFCISPREYPLTVSEALYTYDAYFIKDFNYNLITPIKSNVITLAAINLQKTEISKDEYEIITEKKIRLLFNMAYMCSVDNLILGAWGCGVFKNDPIYIASLFKKILIDEEKITLFNNVEFAIINDKNSVDNNFEIFKKTLQ